MSLQETMREFTACQLRFEDGSPVDPVAMQMAAEILRLREKLEFAEKRYDDFFNHCLKEHINREEFTKLQKELENLQVAAVKLLSGGPPVIPCLRCGRPKLVSFGGLCESCFKFNESLPPQKSGAKDEL